MISLIRYFVQRHRMKAGLSVAPPSAPFVGISFDALPKLRYDCEVFDPQYEEKHISDYLSAKGRTGWRLHTIQQIPFGERYKYFLTWDRLEREVAPYERYGD